MTTALRWPGNALTDAMFRDRAQTFGPEGLNWCVVIDDDREIDQFDKRNPVYIIAHYDDGAYRGSCRLMPAAKPHMLKDVFHYQVEIPELTLELSRLCFRGLETLDELICGAETYATEHGWNRIAAVIRPELTDLVVKRYDGRIVKALDVGNVVEFVR